MFTRRNLICAAALIALGPWLPAFAHEEFSQQEIEKTPEGGSLEERKARVATLKQFRMAEGNQQRAIYKVRRAALEASGLSPAEAARALTGGLSMAFPFSAQPELRSTGSVKTLTVLIDFKNYRAATVLPGLTAAGIRDNIYGTGTTAAQAFKPHESLHEYYRRASQDQVDVQGKVLDWHKFAKNRTEYEPAKAPSSLPPAVRAQVQARNDNAAIFKMLSEALDAVDGAEDLSQYDNDFDGDIDLVTILYAGPPTGWGSFWWAYRWEFFVPEATTKKFDGKRAKQFVFQFVDKRGPAGGDFDPTTLLHEMGHAFGLADYYDYEPAEGPQGGVGGLDMMHANQGNQNAFSRWLLDWIKPAVIGMGSPAVRTLNASGSTVKTDKAIAIFPGLTGTGSPGQEMYIIENRHRVGNDTKLPGDGLLIWHVDAAVNSDDSDFANDNSFTDRKLIRLVRADNPNDFTDPEHGTAATYFTTGKALTPSSAPNSHDYAGNDTRITVDQITAAGETMKVRVGFLQTSPTPTAPPTPAIAPAAAEPPTVTSVVMSDTGLDLDDLEALDRQFAGKTAEQLAAQWAQLADQNAANGNPDARLAVRKLLLAHWSAKDGRHSAEAALQLAAEDPLRAQGLGLALAGWAQNAPAAAAKWYLADARAALRDQPSALRQPFTRDAFAGLYVMAPAKAVEGLERLSSTGEIVGAVDGIFAASATLGELPEELGAELAKSKSDLVKARSEVLQAWRAAQEQIKDPAQRREFQLMQHPEY